MQNVLSSLMWALIILINIYINCVVVCMHVL